MQHSHTAVAVFADHQAAEAGVKTLAASGFDMKDLSLVGKGDHTDEKVVGFYNTGDRIQFWGTRGAYCLLTEQAATALRSVASTASQWRRSPRDILR